MKGQAALQVGSLLTVGSMVVVPARGAVGPSSAVEPRQVSAGLSQVRAITSRLDTDPAFLAYLEAAPLARAAVASARNGTLNHKALRGLAPQLALEWNRMSPALRERLLTAARTATLETMASATDAPPPPDYVPTFRQMIEEAQGAAFEVSVYTSFAASNCVIQVITGQPLPCGSGWEFAAGELFDSAVSTAAEELAGLSEVEGLTLEFLFAIIGGAGADPTVTAQSGAVQQPIANSSPSVGTAASSPSYEPSPGTVRRDATPLTALHASEGWIQSNIEPPPSTQVLFRGLPVAP